MHHYMVMGGGTNNTVPSVVEMGSAVTHFDHPRRLKITLEATDDYHVNVIAEEAATGDMTYRVMVARFQ